MVTLKADLGALKFIKLVSPFRSDLGWNPN